MGTFVGEKKSGSFRVERRINGSVKCWHFTDKKLARQAMLQLASEVRRCPGNNDVIVSIVELGAGVVK